MKEIDAKRILTKNKTTAWFGTDYTINLYRGCVHGCIYCDSRSACYHNDEFEVVKKKKNALMILRDNLASTRRKGVIAMGAMSDPYNPFEREELLTRYALELISAYGFGVSVDTKSDLLIRDLDLYQEIAKQAPVLIKFSITTPHDSLSKIIEPNVSVSSERFVALRKCRDAGLLTGVLLMPCLPFLEDNEEDLLKLIEMAHEAGARFIIAYFGVTMREGNREYFYQKCDEQFPNLKERYQQTYGQRYQCNSRNAKRLYTIFKQRCDELGIITDMNEVIRVSKRNFHPIQMSLGFE